MRFLKVLSAIGIAVMCLVSELCAVPANPFPRQVKQADESIVDIVMRGDEFFNWLEDTNGYVIAFDNNTKNWCYAYISNDKILPSSVAVGGSGVVTRGMPLQRITATDLRPLIGKLRNAKETMGFAQKNTLRSENSVTAAAKNMNPSLLVMLIEYSDASIVKSMDYWHSHFFGNELYQLNHYFNEVSDGKFQYQGLKYKGNYTGAKPTGVSNIEFYENGLVKVTLSKKHPVYLEINDRYVVMNNDIVEKDMKTAFNAVKSYFDFTQFSSDLHNGGHIKSSDLAVYAITAGWEFSGGGNTTNDYRTIWAHAMPFQLPGDATFLSVKYSNLELQTYAVQGEIFEGKLNSSATVMGVGVSVHELGHTLGLADLYDYTYESPGIGPYSLMAVGSWGGGLDEVPGYRPVHLDAFSKIALGFVEPIEVTANLVCENWKGNLNTINAGGEYNVLKVTNTAVDKNQYFLLENRGFNGYDEGFYFNGISPFYKNDGGILIYHIDESVRDEYYGLFDNSNLHRRAVSVEEADGSNVLKKKVDGVLDFSSCNHFFSNTLWTPDVFWNPYGSKQGKFNVFNSSTIPNSNFYNSKNGTLFKPSGISIKINSEKSQTMEVEVVSSLSEGHSFTLWHETIAPNCEIEGEEIEKCSKCGMFGTITRPIDALEHNLSEWDTTKAATCETEGEETEKCSLCGTLGEITQIIPKLTGDECQTPISPQKYDNRYGIKFTQNPVFDKAEISIILPENAIIAETKIVVYDNIGNIVAKRSNDLGSQVSKGRPQSPLVWNLQNQNGKIVANGTYLVIAEVKSQNGQNYYYSAKLGVKR